MGNCSARSCAVSSPTWKMPSAVRNLGIVVSLLSFMELTIFLADFFPKPFQWLQIAFFQVINIGCILDKIVIQKRVNYFRPNPSILNAFLEAK